LEIDTKEALNIDLDWQVGSKTPPRVCLCCGFPFDTIKRKIMGPYNGSPYIWLCSDCHSKDFLHSPDKEFTKIDLKGVIVNMKKSAKTTRNENVIQEKLLRSSDLSIISSEYPGLTNYEGKKIRIPLKYIPVIDLKLDSNNVRFRHISPNLSDMEMEELIWKDITTLSLYKDIQNTSGIIEPLYVDVNNVVIEGNRRLVCLRKLARNIRNDVTRTLSVKLVDPVPCRVIPNDLSTSDKYEFLARIHIGGKKQWRALDQASHLHELCNMYGKSLDLLSEITNLTKKTISDSLRAYEITSEYHKRHSEDGEWVSKYSYFFELIKKPGVEKWIRNKTNLRMVMRWIADKQISRGDEIRRIPRLIQDKTAISRMKRGKKLSDAFASTEKGQKQKISEIKKPLRINDNRSGLQHQMTLEYFFDQAKETLSKQKNIELDDRNIIQLRSLRDEIDNILNAAKQKNKKRGKIINNLPVHGTKSVK
jgi:hypothetical protein